LFAPAILDQAMIRSRRNIGEQYCRCLRAVAQTLVALPSA
jgi:hypothetical protein